MLRLNDCRDILSLPAGKDGVEFVGECGIRSIRRMPEILRVTRTLAAHSRKRTEESP